MKSISKSIIIHAPAERVWQVLTDFAAYPEWLLGAPQISGVLEPGQCLQIASGLPAPHAPIACTLLLRRVTPPYELRWALHQSPGLSGGERRFAIEIIGQDQVRFTQSEVFHGVFAPALACLLSPATRQAFHRMNQALKARAEQPAPPSIAEETTVWPPPPTRAPL